jgi:NADH-quinone oxidoreductase subunit I
MAAPKLTLAERLYLPQVIGGVAVTTRHFLRNLALHTLHLFGVARDQRRRGDGAVSRGAEDYTEGYRGAHRLTLKPDGSVRCTACFLCATACPAKCINIEAGEHPDPEVEKYPVRYEIDTLQCIYCGMCVEACPCDAIRMDTYVHPRLWGYRREDFIEPKSTLMERSRVLQSAAGTR